MGLFNRRASRAAALAEPAATIEELLTEIRRLTEANRSRRDRQTERRLLALRHLAGVRLAESGEDAEYRSRTLPGCPTAVDSQNSLPPS